MIELSAGSIARLASGVIGRFQGSGAIDFRVPPGEPDKLRVSILFSHGLDAPKALQDLKFLAERAGLRIADEEATEHSVSIAIPALRHVKPREILALGAPSAAVPMPDDLREESSYSGISRKRALWRSGAALFRQMLAAWTPPLRPAGAK